MGTYIDKQHTTVAEWVALRPICEVYDMETRYKIWGRRHEPWWREMAARKQLRATLEDIFAAERV